MHVKEIGNREYFIEKSLPSSISLLDEIESICVIEERGEIIVVKKKGKYLATYNTTTFARTREYKFWMISNKKSQEDIFPNCQKYSIICCTNIPEKNMIAFSLSNRTLQLINYNFEKKSTKIVYTSDTHHCIKWIPQVEAVATAGLSGLVYLWNINYICSANYKPLSIFDDSYKDLLALNSPWFQGTPITDIIYLTQFLCIATASSDKEIRIWDVSSMVVSMKDEFKDYNNLKSSQIVKPSNVLKGHKNSIKKLIECPEIKIMASIGYERYIYIWNPKSDEPIEKISGHDDFIVDVIYLNYACALVSIDIKGIVKVWSIYDYSCLQTIGLLSPSITGLFPLYDSKRILAVTNSIHSLEFLMILPLNDSSVSPILCSEYSDKRDEIFIADGNTIVVFDARSNALKFKFSGISDDEISYLSMDSDHRHLICGESNGHAKLVDIENGAVVLDFGVHKKDIIYTFYSNKNHWLVAVSTDGVASIKTNSNIYNESFPRVDIELTGLHKEDITAASYFEDCNMLLTASRDRHAKLWSIDHNKLEVSIDIGYGDIKVASFLVPFPMFFISDNEGRLMLWNVKANSENKYECLCEWYNAFNLSLNIPVTAMSYVFTNGHLLLVVGDMKGFVTVYDITALYQYIQPYIANIHKSVPRSKRIVSNKANEPPNEQMQDIVNKSIEQVKETINGKEVTNKVHRSVFDQSMLRQLAKSASNVSHIDMITKIAVSERSNGIIIFSSSYDKNSKIWLFTNELTLAGIVNVNSVQWKYKPYEKKQTASELISILNKSKNERAIKPKHSIGNLEELDILIEPGEVITTNEVIATIKDLDKNKKFNLDESIHYGKVLSACKKKASMKRVKKF